MNEFIIWGIPPQQTTETLLHTKSTSIDNAKKVIGILETVHGCTNCRIQVLNPTDCPSRYWNGLTETI